MNEEAFIHAIRYLDLTPTEEDVLRLVCQGYTNTRIAIIRDTSDTAVEKMVSRLRKGLQVETKGRLAGRINVNPRVSLLNRMWEIAWKNREVEINNESPL